MAGGVHLRILLLQCGLFAHRRGRRPVACGLQLRSALSFNGHGADNHRRSRLLCVVRRDNKPLPSRALFAAYKGGAHLNGRHTSHSLGAVHGLRVEQRGHHRQHERRRQAAQQPVLCRYAQNGGALHGGYELLFRRRVSAHQPADVRGRQPRLNRRRRKDDHVRRAHPHHDSGVQARKTGARDEARHLAG